MTQAAIQEPLSKTNLSWDQHMAQHIVLLDGMSGSGKALIAPLLTSLERGELWQLDYLYDYICVLDHYQKMDRNAACTLANLSANTHLYNLMISRNTNFRSTDISSIFANGLADRHEKRLAVKDGDAIVDRIRKTQPILTLMTHYTFAVSDVLFEAFGNRLKAYINIVRHPLWLVESWFKGKWHEKYGKNPRCYQILFDVAGKPIPWYAAELGAEYERLSPIDLSIRIVEIFIRSNQKRFKTMNSEDQSKVLVIPFERFVVDPNPFLKQICEIIGTVETAFTKQILTDSRIPRLFDDSDISSKRNEIEKLLNEQNASKECRESLQNLSQEYEEEYLN